MNGFNFWFNFVWLLTFQELFDFVSFSESQDFATEQKNDPCWRDYNMIRYYRTQFIEAIVNNWDEQFETAYLGLRRYDVSVENILALENNLFRAAKEAKLNAKYPIEIRVHETGYHTARNIFPFTEGKWRRINSQTNDWIRGHLTNVEVSYVSQW